MPGPSTVHPHAYVMAQATFAAVDAVAPAKMPSMMRKAGKALGLTREYTAQEQMTRIAASVAHNIKRPVICNEQNNHPEHVERGIVSVQVEVAPGRHQVIQLRNGKIA